LSKLAALLLLTTETLKGRSGIQTLGISALSKELERCRVHLWVLSSDGLRLRTRRLLHLTEEVQLMYVVL
jgi:hypothetical protein